MAKSNKTGRDSRNNQETPEVLTDDRKAEQAVKQAKAKNKHC